MAKSESCSADLYGNLDGIADPSWSRRWVAFTPEELHEHMASVANWGPLSPDQMESLIQGMPPPPYGRWPESHAVLEEHAPLIERLRQDMERSVISRAPMPNEFAAWCDQLRVTLPEPMVTALALIATQRKAVPSPQSSITIPFPSWVPLTPQAAVKPPKNKLGRPPSKQAQYKRLVEGGSKILLAAARKGQVMTICDVARSLQATEIGAGFTVGNITRRLKSNLPLDAAKAIAHRPRS